MPRFLPENAFAWRREKKLTLAAKTRNFCDLTIVAKAMAARFFPRRHPGRMGEQERSSVPTSPRLFSPHVGMR
jgi:hypothetical protein